MSKFLDGPAAGVSLSIRRAPLLLRVVRSRNGSWDALDQLDDEPKPGETVHVYKRASEPNSFHLCIRGKGKAAAGWYEVADYAYLDVQPDDGDVRDTDRWRVWCQANGPQIIGPPPAPMPQPEGQL